MKIKRPVIKKSFDGELYTFKNGKAVIPGCSWKHKPMYITLKEFKELTK